MSKVDELLSGMQNIDTQVKEGAGMSFGEVNFEDISPIKKAADRASATKTVKTCGRKKKPLKEQETASITLKVTPDQKIAIKKLAGIAGESTYIKSKLKKIGIL